ncbi:MAG: hypothetical protein NTV04_11510, partial [Deltaproteobacteria bacterium]|nr:hypothetical protein [Deltaproteobacteria bacterium]
MQRKVGAARRAARYRATRRVAPTIEFARLVPPVAGELFTKPSRAEKKKELSIENLSGKSRLKVPKPN